MAIHNISNSNLGQSNYNQSNMGKSIYENHFNKKSNHKLKAIALNQTYNSSSTAAVILKFIGALFPSFKFFFSLKSTFKLFTLFLIELRS